MRRLMLGAATAMVAVTAGCSMLGKAAFQQPVVNLKDVSVQGVGLTGGQLAVKLNVAPSTVNRILVGASAIGPEMALRLAKTLGRSPESWLSLQHNHDLWQARRRVDLAAVSPLKLATA